MTLMINYEKLRVETSSPKRELNSNHGKEHGTRTSQSRRLPKWDDFLRPSRLLTLLNLTYIFSQIF